MHPIQAVITAWPFPRPELDPVMFFRESPLHFQGLLDGDELLELLQRGAVTAIEYVVPQPTGSCVSQFLIRHTASLDGTRFTVSAVAEGVVAAEPLLHSPERDAIAAWLHRRGDVAKDAAPPATSLSAQEASPLRDHPPTSAPPPAKRFMVAYIRTEERRRAGYSVRAAYAYRKAHPEARPFASESRAFPAPTANEAGASDTPASGASVLDRVDELLDRLAAGEIHAIAYGDRDLPHADGLGVRVTFNAKAHGKEFAVRTREMEIEGRSLCFAIAERDELKATLSRLIGDFERLERSLARLRAADPRMSRAVQRVHRLYAIATSDAERAAVPASSPGRMAQGQR